MRNVGLGSCLPEWARITLCVFVSGLVLATVTSVPLAKFGSLSQILGPLSVLGYFVCLCVASGSCPTVWGT